MNFYRDSTFTKNDIEGSKTQLFSYKFINKAGYVNKTDDIDKTSSKKLTKSRQNYPDKQLMT